MTSKKVRQKYLEFFKSKRHIVVPSASLIPENDPTTLFTSAGMQPLIPFLMGEKHPADSSLVNCQKCIRTGDIDDVGDAWHLTFFEMLGNWPMGAYDKKQMVEWSWEFLTSEKWLNINPDKLYITVYEGDKDIPKDEESIKFWQQCFEKANIDAKENERIFALGKKDNFWGPVGNSGPCGPDTEMFVDTGKEKCCPECRPGCNCGKYSEIWNDVFMFYYKNPDGTYKKLKNKQIDTGFGLERATAILNGADNVYESDLFIPIINKIKELANIDKPNPEQLKSIRIIADHIRSAVLIMGDDLGIAPSNLDQGYVIRRLIRTAIRHGKLLNIPHDINLSSTIAEIVINLMKDVYPELDKNKKFILAESDKEENKFEKTLDRGLKILYKEFEIIKAKNGQEIKFQPGEFENMKINNHLAPNINGKLIFDLYTTYGFPKEMVQNDAKSNNIKISKKAWDEFDKLMKKHRELSRTASIGMFKGGLANHSEIVTKYHTATHLLHRALRQVLGEHVKQRGSNLTEKRLRFDFSHFEKMTDEQIKQVENLVNEIIKKGLPVEYEEKSLDQAKNEGAIGLFGDKYGDKVKVYTIGDFSKEICGGPHIKNTSELGHFKIIKEQSASAGIRRIKAVLE